MNDNQCTTTFLLRNNVDYSLFKFAINSAKKGLKVWFISVKPFEKVPKDIQPPCKDALQLITFIYLNDFVALIKHLNSVHKWNNIPNYVILKNFEVYSDLYDTEYDSTRTGFIVASLLDCVRFLSKKNNNSKVYLLVSCRKTASLDPKRLKILQDMYFDHFLFDDDLNDEAIVEKVEAL